MEKEVIGW